MVWLASDPVAFTPFSTTHAIVAGSHAAAAAVLILLGRRWRGTEAGESMHILWTGFVTIVQLVNVVFWSTPPRLELATSLPLHICDLAGMAAIIALITEARWARMLMLYWGIGLSTQAFITPVITDAPDTMRFQIFFLSHLTVVATPLYDLLVRRFRPTWNDCAWGVLITLAYGGLVIPLNMLFGWNYGYAGQSTPDNPTLLDKLGPWPLRLVWMTGIVSVFFVAVTAIARALFKDDPAAPVTRHSRR
jgi:hypothetical integral membrane protein (TIGR02206 family)